jgi:hypothetical protein
MPKTYLYLIENLKKILYNIFVKKIKIKLLLTKEFNTKMANFKSFKLTSNATLRIRTDRIIATIHSDNGNKVEIYCSDAAIPFHVEADSTPGEIVDYIWEGES